jgi:alpha-1,6-mannosyltransferase
MLPDGRSFHHRLPGAQNACTPARRNNGRIQAATPITCAPIARNTPEEAARTRRPDRFLEGLGALGLLGVLASVFLLAAGAATRPSSYVPARTGGWPDWLAGPLQGLDVGLTRNSFQTYMLIMSASYVLVLIAVRALPLRALAGTIVAANVILLLGPPLISQDVFGYVAFARMGSLHGLDPYTHVAAEAFTDPVYQFVGWPFKHSPYGALFTLSSYAVSPLGVAGALWAFKAVAAASSLGAVALVARAAGRLGGSRRWAAAFVGLNPVLLVLAVGGAHNDTLIVLVLALALALTAGASQRFRAAAGTLVAGVGVKLTAGLLLPFLILGAPRRERVAVLASACLSLLALGALALIGFGSHALSFLNAVGEQQQLVATHSIPAETARLVGLTGTPTWWRHLFVGGFVAVLAIELWRTARGADWRAAAGWSTLALLLSTAWLLPWYAVWLLPLAAVSNDRRLRAATLLFCAYAILIHLKLADPVLSPSSTRIAYHVHTAIPGLRHGLELTGFEVLHDVQLDLRW